MTLEGGLKLRPRHVAVLLAALLPVIGPAVPVQGSSAPETSSVRSTQPSHVARIRPIPVTGAARWIVTLRGFAPDVSDRPASSTSLPTPTAAAAAATAEAARVHRLDETVDSLQLRLGLHVELRYRYALQGFAASLTDLQRSALAADPRVIGISAVRPVQPAGGVVPAGVERINAQPPSDGGPQVPNVASVNVAVLDTGIRYLKDEPDLNINPKGIDCADDAHTGRTGHGAWAEVDTRSGHGTHVAGTIGAEGTDVFGVAPGVRLFSVRVFANRNGRIVGDSATVACGLDWVAATHSAAPPAGTRPIDLVNMSIQGPRASDDPIDCPSPPATLADPEHQASCSVSRLGVTIVAAAGNSGKDVSTSVPAAWSDTIAVGAIADFDGKPGGEGGSSCGEVDDTFASFSNHGDDVDLVAPGVCVLSLGLVVGQTRVMTGTSMAAPHVTGAAARLVALLRSRGKSASPQALRRSLRGSANLDWDASSDPDPIAHRLVDVAAAEAASPAVVAWALPSQVSLTSDQTSAIVQVQLQRRGLYDGDVTLQADSPAGLDVDLMPQTANTSDNPPLNGLGDSGTERSIRIFANGVPDGSYTVTLRAYRAGSSTPDPHATVAIQVTVDANPPSIDQFDAAFVENATAGTAQPLLLTWTGHDNGSGIASYVLQRDDGGGWEDITPFPSTSTSTISLAPVKQDTRFRVQVIDDAGNKSSWSTITVHAGLRDSKKAAITYAGASSWKTRTDDGAFGGSVRRSRTTGSFAVTGLPGVGLAWVAPTGPNFGSALVSVDGGAWTSVDLSASKSHERRVVFATGTLAGGSHTIEVKVDSGIVDVDAFEFLSVTTP